MSHDVVRRGGSPFVRAFLIVAVAASSLAAQTVFAPMKLRVLNGTSQARTQEPVVCGFPVAESENVFNPFLFRVKDPNGVPIPAQFRALTRWNGVRTDATKKLRWVQAAFLATVPASSFADYEVDYGTFGPGGSLLVIPGSSSTEIRNGTGGIFVVKNTSFFTPFKVVEIDGTTVLNSSLGNGAVEMTSSTGATISAVPTSTVLEQFGSVMAVIRQKGDLGPLKYTCRWTFFAGRLDPQLEFRLENPAAYGLFATTIPNGESYFDKLGLMQPFGGSSPVVTTPSGTFTPSATAPFAATQTFAWTSNPLDVHAGFSFTEKLGASTVATGGRHQGALDFKTNLGGVSVGVDRFWQNFPASLGATASQIRLGFWPDFGSGPDYGGQYAIPGSPTFVPDPLAANNYRFEGGRWKTRRTVWDFRLLGTRTPADVAAFAERVASPLIAAPEPSRVRTSEATGHLFREKSAWTGVELNRFEQFGAMIGDDAAADSIPNYGKIGLPGYLARGGTWGGVQPYGWWTDGDIPWADGYCSGHYDWPGTALMEFLRKRDYKLFAQGKTLASYRRDYGQNHSTNTAENWRGAQFYEKGWWHGNYAVGQQSHNWALGLGLLYVTTGDEGAYEALVQNMDFVLRFPPKTWTGYWGDRILGWAVDNLVDGWAFVGDPLYLTEAGLGADRYQVLELADGGLGFHLNPGSTPPSTKPWMAAIAFRGIARYSIASKTSTHDALLTRMRNWMVNSTLVQSTGRPNARTLPYTFDTWTPAGGGVTSSVHLVWGHIDALSLYAHKTGDTASYALSKDLFDAVVRYWQLTPSSPAQNFTNPSSFSAVTMRPLQYPNAESKALGNLHQWGRTHVAVRAAAGDW
jgi:hypothetical protein